MQSDNILAESSLFAQAWSCNVTVVWRCNGRWRLFTQQYSSDPHMIVVLCARMNAKLVAESRDVPARLMLCDSHANRIFPIFPIDDEWFNSSTFLPEVPLSQDSRALSLEVHRRNTTANMDMIRAFPAADGGALEAAPAADDTHNADAADNPPVDDSVDRTTPVQNPLPPGESIFKAQVEVVGGFADNAGDDSEITTSSAWNNSFVDDDASESSGPPAFTPPSIAAISAFNRVAAQPLQQISAARRRRIVSSDDSQENPNPIPTAPPGKQAGAHGVV